MAAAPEYTTLLVRLQPSATASARAKILQISEGMIVGEISQLGLLSISVPTDRVTAILATLRQNKAVRYAEPDARAWATLSPNDPGWAQQWGPQKIRAPLAWNITTGEPDLIIAVIDSGIALSHPDLINQLWVNPGEVPANNIDDDGNGQIDDVWGWHFYHGWNGQTYVPMENDQIADDYGHGTHVAGIAAAEIDNDVGIAGMAAGSRLMTIKVLDQYGLGWYSDIAQGIVYAVDNGARIVNLSLGGVTSSQTLQDAADYAHERGVLVVAAAGNDGGDVLYPAACEHVLAVAATDPNDQHPSFSNHGPEVDVAAPGVDIYSTWPWLDGYWTKSGTSMAAPHVSGAAALLWSTEPNWTPEQVTEVITNTARDVDVPGWDEYTGWGRIDVWSALHRDPYRVYLPMVYPLCR
jgi:subtilisin family serine protease